MNKGQNSCFNLCMAAELLPLFAVFLSSGKLSYYNQQLSFNHHIDERMLLPEWADNE